MACLQGHPDARAKPGKVRDNLQADVLFPKALRHQPRQGGYVFPSTLPRVPLSHRYVFLPIIVPYV
jgi:hypothetical protein